MVQRFGTSDPFGYITDASLPRNTFLEISKQHSVLIPYYAIVPFARKLSNIPPPRKLWFVFYMRLASL